MSSKKGQVEAGLQFRQLDRQKIFTYKLCHKTTLFSAFSDRSHRVEYLGIFKYEKIPNIDQDICNLMDFFWPPPAPKGDYFDT